MLVFSNIQFGILFVDELIFLQIAKYISQKYEGQPERMEQNGLGASLYFKKMPVDLIQTISNTQTLTRKHKRGH